MKDPARQALLALFAVTLIWGATFLWNKDVVLAVEAHFGPEGRAAALGLFLCVRFGLSALFMPLLPAVRRGLFRADAARGGFWIGGLLAAGFMLQMFGLQEVSPAVSAFLTSLYVVFTALLGRMRFGALGRRIWLGVIVATLGAAFIGGPPHVALGLGEWLTILSAFIFAFHILATDHVTKRSEPLAVTTWSFVAGSLAGLGLLVVAAPQAFAADPEFGAKLWSFVQRRDFLVPLALLCFLGTNLALTLMNVFQRALSPVRAAVVYALEPVWAALISIGAGREDLTPWFFAGGAALLAGNLIIELKPRLPKPSNP